MGSETLDQSKTLARRMGRVIRQLREAQNLSQDELAWKCDVHRTYMGFVERGEYNITVVKLGQIAKGLGVKPSQILQELGQ